MGNYHIELGKQLKARRLEQKRELKDIAKETKVTEEYLEAIEDGRIDAFPTTVYYNLFARSYARELGLNPDSLFVITTAESMELERIEALGSEENEEEILSLESRVRNNSSWAKIAIWIAGIIVAVFVAVLLIFNLGSKAPKRESITEPTVNESTVDNSGILTPDSTDLATDSIIDSNRPVKPPEPKMKLRIDAVALSWILVMADGDTMLNRNLDSGSYRTLEAESLFVITSGNPDGLIMKLNDTLLGPISSSGRPVRNVEINRLNKDQFYLLETESDSEVENGGRP